MYQPKGFEKPVGLKDYLPDAVAKLRRIRETVLGCMARWGYREVITPTLEYYDTVGVASATPDHKIFKLLDRNGRTLILRPELTAPIARVVASMLREQELPLRLSYHANVFRAPEEEAGRDAEFFQTGVELIGEGSADADAEVIALAVACLQACGVPDFKIAIGHIGFLNGLLQEALPAKEEEQQELKALLLQRNIVGFHDRIRHMGLDTGTANRLRALPRLRGGVEVCDAASALTADPVALAALAHLREVWQALTAHEVTSSVMLDLTMIGDFSYYTGVTFEGYADSLGFPLCSGGRYDQLLTQFDRPAPATGFALKANRILELWNKQLPAEESPVVVIYVPAERPAALGQANELRKSASRPVITHLLHEAVNGEAARTAVMQQLLKQYGASEIVALWGDIRA